MAQIGIISVEDRVPSVEEVDLVDSEVAASVAVAPGEAGNAPAKGRIQSSSLLAAGKFKVQVQSSSLDFRHSNVFHDNRYTGFILTYFIPHWLYYFKFQRLCEPKYMIISKKKSNRRICHPVQSIT